MPSWNIFYSQSEKTVCFVFVLSQLWRGSCNLNCFIYMFKGIANQELRADTSQCCIVCLCSQGPNRNWTQETQTTVAQKGRGPGGEDSRGVIALKWSLATLPLYLFIFNNVTQICALKSQPLCVNFIPRWKKELAAEFIILAAGVHW